MTKNRSAKKCEECGIRPIDFTTQGRDSWGCTECHEYAGEVNRHSDEGHEAIRNFTATTVSPSAAELVLTKDCPVCHPELDPRLATNRKIIARDLSKWPAEKSKNMSHKSCGHPLTKVERAKCRAGKSIKKSEKNLDESRKILDDIIAQQDAENAYDPHALPSTPVRAEMLDECPKCGATGSDACTTASGGRVRSNGGRHPARDSK